MISQDLLEILRCPHCVREKEGALKLVKETWLVCQEPDWRAQIPILDDIPVMLIDEGDKWIRVAEGDLPSRRLPSEAGLPDLQFLIDELTSGDDARAEPASRRLAELDNSALSLLSQLLILGEVDQRWWAVRTSPGLPRLKRPSG